MSAENGIVRVTAPAFEVKLTIERGICVTAEPPLTWALGQDVHSLRAAFENRRWTATILRPLKHGGRDG